MNIEIANRLVQLRKEKNLSQEALASELGISRQAVSKWERAEASPDTDNLILLAQLYGMSLDDLLKTNQGAFESGEASNEESKTNNDGNDDTSFHTNKNGDYVHISLKNGIHVKEKGGDEVHVGWDGIHVHSKEEDDEHQFHLDKNGIYVDGRKYDKDSWKREWEETWLYHYDFPIGVLVTVAYIYIGIVYSAWHPGWLLFGIIPLFHSMISAFKHRDILRFAFPVLILMIIGYYGFIVGVWYPYWLLILTIPVFYSFFGYFKHLARKNKMKNSEEEE